MTLNSPGVQITVNDLSNYTPAPTGTVPLIILATAENKTNPAGSLATYTTAATAGNLVLVTNQNDLLNYFGAPTFYTSQGTPINADELNEYGLLTAYSALGASNGAYILRANVDLASLAGSLTPPTAAPANGTLWLDTTDTVWGIFQWNASTQSFTNILPSNASGSGQLIVISSTLQTTGAAANYSVPLASLGKPGDYAVVTTNVNNPVYYKDSVGTWVEVGTAAWQASIPAVVGTTAITSSIAPGNIIVVNGTSVNTAGTITTIVSNLNSNLVAAGITAASVNNQVAFYISETAANNQLVISGAGATDLGITANTYYPPVFQASPSTSVPTWNSFYSAPRPTGSVWFNTTSAASGASIVFKQYNSTTASWTSLTVPVAAHDAAVNYQLDPLGGGINIPAGSAYLKYCTDSNGNANLSLGTFSTELLVRQTGATVLTGSVANVSLSSAGTSNLTISTSAVGSASYSNPVTVTFTGAANSATDSTTMVNAINAASIPGIVAGVTSVGDLYIENVFGGSFKLTDGNNAPLTKAGFALTSAVQQNNTIANVAIGTNWVAPTYTASATVPTVDPATGTYWYYSDPTQFDIMINTANGWAGYGTVAMDARGYALTNTDPLGPIVSASQPTVNNSGSALKAGDIWIDTANLYNMPNIWRYSGSTWVQINVTDHVTPNGVVFADARWSTTGNVDPASSTLTSIAALKTSNYVDPDCPNHVLYPVGTLLFNTRRSGLNVKQFTTGYFAGGINPFTNTYYTQTSAWVTASGNNTSGVAYMATQAQRNIVVESLASAVNSCTELLNEAYVYELIACPGYPELHSTLVTLNENIQETAFIVGDSPMTLPSDSNSLNTWANNLNGAVNDGIEGLVTDYNYLSVYYPSALTTDLAGNRIVAPSSYMALRTILESDNISYPWFAPAGARRGLVSNAVSAGYVNQQTGSFVAASLPQGVRDVLYEAAVNPIPYLNGIGLTVYGQKTHTETSTALDRVNVARLVIYIRRAVNQIARQYVFEPNDPITRSQIANQISQFLQGLVTQRGLNDYAVVCDTTNNPPAVIDANELYVDIAIEPIKAAEFIYIPISLLNTGAIASQSST